MGNIEREVAGPTISSPPCSTCQGFDKLERTFETKYSEVRKSGDSGCSFCKWVAAALYMQGYCELAVPDKVVQVSRAINKSVQIWERDSTKSSEELIGIEIFASSGLSQFWPRLGRLPEISTDSGSDSALHTIKTWLHNCLETHQDCRQIELPTLPTRVLDLRFAEPRVWETQGRKGKYIALSHCWGTERGLTATNQSMPLLKVGINVNALQKTFRDAVETARALGVSFLWIDSLCILQDCRDDWTRESSKMWDVYRNSFLTIVAAGSPGDNYGFVGPRQQLPTTYTYSETSKIIFRRHAHSGPAEPLYSRAWTFQERFLSPRMIKFKRHELEWHCRTSKACECEHYTDKKSRYGTGQIVSSPLTPSRTINFAYQDLSTGSLEQAHFIWSKSIVEPYSRLLLTKSSDRLPALSGLASMLNARFHEEAYAAGLWRSDLVQGLQWYRPGGTESIENYEVLLPGPSWSWASVSGPITFALSGNDKQSWTRQVLAIVETVHCRGIGLDQHGIVTGGTLRIKAPILELQVAAFASPDNVQHSYKFRRQGISPSIVFLDHNTPDEFMFYPDNVLNPLWGLGSDVKLRPGKRSGGLFSERDSVWILFLEVERESHSKDVIYRCLVLGPKNPWDVNIARLGYWAFISSDPEWLESTEYRTITII